jgi:DHA1 family multidrug resistance protein-like MFS transporter
VKSMQPSPLRSITSTFKNYESLSILCIQVAVLHIGQGLITPILPLYAQTFAVSITWVGFLLTSQSLPRVFVNLPAGRLADKWGAHRLMMVAAGIVALSAIGGGLASNYLLFLLTRLLQGVGTGISQTSGFTYAATVSRPETRARFISLYQGSFLLGAGIGPAFGGLIAQQYGYRAPFFAYAFFSAFVGVWMSLRLPDPRTAGRQRKAVPSQLQATRSGMWKVLAHPGVLLVSLLGLLGGYTRSGSRNMAVTLQGSELGLSESQIGVALSGVFVMTFLALFLAGTLADRYGRKAVIVPSWLFIGGTLWAIAMAPTYALFLLSTAAMGLAFGVGSPVPAAYVADTAAEDEQGLAIGVFRTFNDGGAVIGPLLMGWIIDQADVSAGLLVNAGTAIFAALAFWVLAPEPGMKQEEVGHSPT